MIPQVSISKGLVMINSKFTKPDGGALPRVDFRASLYDLDTYYQG